MNPDDGETMVDKDDEMENKRIVDKSDNLEDKDVEHGNMSSQPCQQNDQKEERPVKSKDKFDDPGKDDDGHPDRAGKNEKGDA